MVLLFVVGDAAAVAAVVPGVVVIAVVFVVAGVVVVVVVWWWWWCWCRCCGGGVAGGCGSVCVGVALGKAIRNRTPLIPLPCTHFVGALVWRTPTPEARMNPGSPVSSTIQALTNTIGASCLASL